MPQPGDPHLQVLLVLDAPHHTSFVCANPNYVAIGTIKPTDIGIDWVNAPTAIC